MKRFNPGDVYWRYLTTNVLAETTGAGEIQNFEFYPPIKFENERVERSPALGEMRPVMDKHDQFCRPSLVSGGQDSQVSLLGLLHIFTSVRGNQA